jgi:SMODS-associated and fused to various effectors sensor domain
VGTTRARVVLLPSRADTAAVESETVACITAPIVPTFTALLAARDLPLSVAGTKVQPIDCDLFPLMTSHPPKITAALSIQADWMNKAISSITTTPDAEIAYYGIVYIPLQFLAGYRFSTFRRVRLFELDREEGSWSEVRDSRSKAQVSLSVDYRGAIEEVEDVAIRISISYLIRARDVLQVIPVPHTSIHIQLATPKIDAIGSSADLRMIAKVFRETLDREEVRGKRLHLFYAGPVSLGFTLGQQISSTIHGEVHVYNYNSVDHPAYAWSIKLNDNPRENDVRRH